MPEHIKKISIALLSLFLQGFSPEAEAAETMKCKRPYYEDVADAYETVDGYGNMLQVGETIGGKVQVNLENKIFRNACALRVSYALFNAPSVRSEVKCTIPAMGNDTASGKDKLYYIFRLHTLLRFLEQVYGPPDYDSRRHNAAQLSKNVGEPGIMITLFPGFHHVTGHGQITRSFYKGLASDPQVFWSLPKKSTQDEDSAVKASGEVSHWMHYDGM